MKPDPKRPVDYARVSIIDRFLAMTFLRLIPKVITPNHITAFRFVTIPFVLYFLSIESYMYATILFIISAFSDALDGALARTTGQVSEWGKMYDPVADKLLIGSTAALIVSQKMSHSLTIAIIGLEVMIIILAFWRKRFFGYTIEARWPGKVKMIFQSVGVSALLLFTVTGIPILFSTALYSLCLALFFGVWSIIAYSV